MSRVLRVLVLRFLLVCVASAGFYTVIVRLHDYPQTTQAVYSYIQGDKPLWQAGFYFVNEASSGLKYLLTGNERHFGHFPRSSDAGELPTHSAFMQALYNANGGDWREQLLLSHLYALGWDVDKDLDLAVMWYLRSEEAASQRNEHRAWQNSDERLQVKALISEQLVISGLRARSRPDQVENQVVHDPGEIIAGERS